MAAKLKKVRPVVVLARPTRTSGKDGEITSVMPADARAIVDGVNLPSATPSKAGRA